MIPVFLFIPVKEPMLTALLYIPAAFAEIAGCFCFWAWMRLGRSAFVLLPGCLSLVLFAWLLTFSPADNAGRAYAIYGGVYIAASLIWSWLVESLPPDRWDLGGAAICLAGAAIILLAPHG
ncbi:hypothetical protein GLX_11220 [Komagataeibacter medellinensis NBRC 3288]|uniref:Uncharacterized protein n=2 Tax=Komagataeibacter medellinensis TaxID=1177712 RepID=G2I5Y7_KOMMN|nr:hypothetical protein GLX_11220 [Komagataeibacter medellinensis NBRC 3288]